MEVFGHIQKKKKPSIITLMQNKVKSNYYLFFNLTNVDRDLIYYYFRH